MLVLVIAAALASQPSPLDAAYARVLNDNALRKSINEIAAQPLRCISQLQKIAGLAAALSAEARTKCHFDAGIAKAALTIRSRCPEISSSLAERTAAKYLMQIMYYNALFQDSEMSK